MYKPVKNSFGEWVLNTDMGALWSKVAGDVCIVIGAISVLIMLAWLLLRARVMLASKSSFLAQTLYGKETIGFFHPYCAAGGGGERVLWCAIRSIQKHFPDMHCVIFTGDAEAPKGELLREAEQRFGVTLKPDTIHFVFLGGRSWIEASSWPRFTMLGQSFGSILLSWEAILQFCPGIVIDSMGYAFTYPVFHYLGNSRVGCYVHYPTISTDMLARVRDRDVAVCNNATVASSDWKSAAKLVYYRIFAFLYGSVGQVAEVVMVNSSWTRGHIDHLWKIPSRTSTVFPPCDTAALLQLPAERAALEDGGKLVLSLAQFRPEKDHPKQLRAFAQFLASAPEHAAGGSSRVRLVVAGGVRNDGDRGRLASLRELCRELKLVERTHDDVASESKDWDVDFRTNLAMEEVHALLGQATVGLHTMRDEHFGINVVEFMASGAVALAHDSAGPSMDIVTKYEGHPTGFLAKDEIAYATALKGIFALSNEARQTLVSKARKSVADRFSQEAFEETFASKMIATLRSRPVHDHVD